MDQAMDLDLDQQQHDDAPMDSMAITSEERQWALAIKQAVSESEELSPINDFDLVQYAMITQGNTEEALARMEGMQSFREHYDIDNSAEQGVRCLQLAMDLLPRFLLHLDNCPDTNEAILAWDASVFYPDLVLAPCSQRGADFYWKNYVSASYYMYYCTQPNLASIRKGLTLLLDCGQVEWENVSIDFERRMHDELRGYYPLKWNQLLAYNTAFIANVGWGLFKQFMNPHMRESLQLGCQVSGADSSTRLYELFLQPSLEGAQINILRRARDLLLMRAQNAQSFTL
ncbi:expressed unknown protein [Seminavis robusta]|uniref:CRAL-TRIO domain-containing protein n=1 Tax=Seminavis robusta TaxID=568900 RepID=A0A9N8E2H7_9STRA|nr:expressed unknown protein [Seminavis robusta]|eukprot:Sro490_g153430.1 n/a (286) ;mRNA; r:4074-4931